MSDLTQQQANPTIDLYIQRRYAEIFGYGLANAWITGRGLVAVSELSPEAKFTYIPKYAVEQGSDRALVNMLADYDHFVQVIFGCPHPHTGRAHYTVLELMWRAK